MKKFGLLAGLLALATLECEEGGTCQLSDVQLQTLEDKVKDLTESLKTAKKQLTNSESQVQDLQAKLKAKEAELLAMAKKPAEGSQQVNNQSQAKKEPSPMQEYCNEVARAKAMLDKLN